jgi:type II secretory pathway component PulF
MICGDSGFITAVLAAILWFLLWLVPMCALTSLGYYFFSLPMRRRESARFFLDLLEVGLKVGKRVEDTIVDIAHTRDAALPRRFNELAACLRQGLTLGQGLDVVPRALPPQIMAMLRAGLKIGDIGRVLPACRQFLQDGLSQTRGAVNYLMVLCYVITPMAVAAFAATRIFVLPKFMDVAANMGVDPLPTGLVLAGQYGWWVVLAQVLLLNVIWLGALIYVCGPSLNRWTDITFGPLRHRISYVLPWRRKRLQRDFATMLAVLLDAGVPEPEALGLAANCTANEVFRRRAERAKAGLREGLKLTEAIARVDDTGEFRWRLANALQSGKGFLQAITGWNESLDAHAFQQEQATAQAVSTGLVIVNGVFIGILVLGVFGTLVAIINQGLLW